MSREHRLRILSFTTLFPNPEEPARGIFVRSRLAKIAEYVDLVVVAPVNAGRNPRVLRTPLRRKDPSGFDVFHPRYAVLPGVLKGWDGAMLFREVYAQIGAALRGRTVDLVDGQYAYPDGAAAARLARSLRVPLVLSVRGSDLEVLAVSGARRKAIMAVLREARVVIAVSRSLERRALELGAPADRIHVVPNGVDLERFRPMNRALAREFLNLPSEGRIVLAVARLDPVKGLDLFIQGIAALRGRSTKNDVRAYIVGEGPARRALEDAVHRFGVESIVTLRGAEPPNSIPRWYAASDAVCLLSHSEGCPNVVLEALACGRPVLATPVGHVPDLIREGENGFLLHRRDPEQVADQLEAVLSASWNADAIAGAGGRSWKTVAEEQTMIYRRAMGWS